MDVNGVSLFCSQLFLLLYSGPRYNVDDIPVDKLHLERALDDDSAAEGVTGHRVTVALSVTSRKWGVRRLDYVFTHFPLDASLDFRN